MVPTLLGFVVIQLLERHFPDFVDAGFTSRMEGALDEIAKGKEERVKYLDGYYKGKHTHTHTHTHTHRWRCMGVCFMY